MLHAASDVHARPVTAFEQAAPPPTTTACAAALAFISGAGATQPSLEEIADHVGLSTAHLTTCSAAGRG